MSLCTNENNNFLIGREVRQYNLISDSEWFGFILNCVSFLTTMGRLIPEIIEAASQYLNPVGQYELSLRGKLNKFCIKFFEIRNI